MRNYTFDDISRAVTRIVQPLYQGVHQSLSGLKATLTDVVPFGRGDNFLHSSPFGLISKPAKGVISYIQNLNGSNMAPVVLGHLHKARPEPAGPGEAILYSTDSTGNSVQVKITLQADGTLVVSAPSKVQVVSDNVEIGSGALEKILNGETFQEYINGHQHLGNLGAPTGPPITPSDATHLSAKVKAAK